MSARAIPASKAQEAGPAGANGTLQFHQAKAWCLGRIQGKLTPAFRPDHRQSRNTPRSATVANRFPSRPNSKDFAWKPRVKEFSRRETAKPMRHRQVALRENIFLLRRPFHSSALSGRVR